LSLLKTVGLVYKIKPQHADITNQIDRGIDYVFGVTLFLQSEYGNIALVLRVLRKGMASVENAFCITYFIDYLTVFYCYSM